MLSTDTVFEGLHIWKLAHKENVVTFSYTTPWVAYRVLAENLPRILMLLARG
jgi:hypothetical protein